jgi:hypothetical protein
MGVPKIKLIDVPQMQDYIQEIQRGVQVRQLRRQAFKLLFEAEALTKEARQCWRQVTNFESTSENKKEIILLMTQSKHLLEWACDRRYLATKLTLEADRLSGYIDFNRPVAVPSGGWKMIGTDG